MEKKKVKEFVSSFVKNLRRRGFLLKYSLDFDGIRFFCKLNEREAFSSFHARLGASFKRHDVRFSSFSNS